jgi:hypothetical protein
MARVKNAGPREHTVRDLFDIAKQAGYEIPRGVTYEAAISSEDITSS